MTFSIIHVVEVNGGNLLKTNAAMWIYL